MLYHSQQNKTQKQSIMTEYSSLSQQWTLCFVPATVLQWSGQLFLSQSTAMRSAVSFASTTNS